MEPRKEAKVRPLLQHNPLARGAGKIVTLRCVMAVKILDGYGFRPLTDTGVARHQCTDRDMTVKKPCDPRRLKSRSPGSTDATLINIVPKDGWPLSKDRKRGTAH